MFVCEDPPASCDDCSPERNVTADDTHWLVYSYNVRRHHCFRRPPHPAAHKCHTRFLLDGRRSAAQDNQHFVGVSHDNCPAPLPLSPLSVYIEYAVTLFFSLHYYGSDGKQHQDIKRPARVLYNRRQFAGLLFSRTTTTEKSPFPSTYQRRPVRRGSTFMVDSYLLGRRVLCGFLSLSHRHDVDHSNSHNTQYDGRESTQ